MSDQSTLTRLVLEQHRIRPMSGDEADRSRAVADGYILDNELHTTNQGRQFLKKPEGDVYMGPTVWLGDSVANESALLGLQGSHPRGCWPGDECARIDTLGVIWRCITNNGALLDDWIQVNAAVGTTLLPHYEPVSDGDATSPQIVFAGRDVVMALRT